MIQRRVLAIISCVAAVALLCTPFDAFAAASSTDNFGVLVTPSPLVATVDPGTQTQLTLKVYDSSTGPESLQIGTQSFEFNSKTGRVNLNDPQPATIKPWIHFSAPTFTLQAGQWLSETISLDMPKDAGFSYSFAVVISPHGQQNVSSGRVLKGSLAVFALINVNRPGATRNLGVDDFSTTKHIYEYLPATIDVRFRNIGNTIVQPYGNIFVGRSANAKKPIATLPVNADEEYILPGTERTVSATWTGGFASYQTTQTSTGNSTQHLTIDWSKLSQFRIGKYDAELVAVYNNGTYDVPIEAETSFWVIPWRAILVLIIVIAGLVCLTHWLGKRRTDKAVKRALAAAEAARKHQSNTTPKGQ